MRIGLLRHFPVSLKFPTGLKTAAELHDWCERYDVAEITVGEAELGDVAWQTCICSDLPRACTTAEALFTGPIERTALLREPRFAQFQTGTFRLPVWMWQWAVRISWLTGHSSQRACRDDFRQRVRGIADRLAMLESDTLVVSHAGMMRYLSSELRRRGFAGPKLGIAQHAKLYTFQSPSAAG